LHEEAVAQRAQSQREVNDLLSRKSTWSDDDVGRFTRLVRQDHLYEQAEVNAKEAAAKAEDDVDKEFSALMRAILNRYHEEQVWSDKIRSASTYGSLAVLGLNVLVFLLATIFIEPWKRRKLAATFEKKVDEMDAKNAHIMGEGMVAIHARLDRQEQTLVQFADAMANAVPSVPAIPPVGEDQPVEPPTPPLPPPPLLPTSFPMSWEEWRVFFNSRTTQQVLVAVSATAFVGGTTAGWILRELRR
jgi:sensitive to high expression protein 9, mitochondrial